MTDNRTIHERAIDEAGKVCAWLIMHKAGDLKGGEFADNVIDLFEEIISEFTTNDEEVKE